MRSVQNTTENVFKLIQLFNRGNAVVIKDIQEELNLKSWTSARRYFDAACLYMPIYESGMKRTGGTPAAEYKILK